MRLDPDLIELQRRRDTGDDDAAAEQYERYDDYLQDAIEAMTDADDLPKFLTSALTVWYRMQPGYRAKVAAIHTALTEKPDGL